MKPGYLFVCHLNPFYVSLTWHPFFIVRLNLKAKIKRLKKNIEDYEANKNRQRSSVSYFESIEPRIIQSADEACVICFEQIALLTVTPCGHLYCFGCIRNCIRSNPTCPTCRQPVSDEQLVVIEVRASESEGTCK